MATYKANSRNAALLEEFLRIRGEEFLKLGGEPAPTKTGWFGGGGKVKQTAAGPDSTQVTANDVEQVKPGAGMSGSEMKDALQSASTQPAATTNKATSGSSGFSFFGGRNKKSTPV